MIVEVGALGPAGEELISTVERGEERRLREIEVSVERADPTLAARLNPERLLAGRRTLARCATAITVVGCGMALTGVLFSWLLAVPGVLMAVVGFSLRLTPPATTRVLNVRRGNGGGQGADPGGAGI